MKNSAVVSSQCLNCGISYSDASDVVKGFALRFSDCETNKFSLFSLIVECMKAGVTEGLKKKIKKIHVLIKGPMMMIFIP